MSDGVQMFAAKKVTTPSILCSALLSAKRRSSLQRSLQQTKRDKAQPPSSIVHDAPQPFRLPSSFGEFMPTNLQTCTLTPSCGVLYLHPTQPCLPCLCPSHRFLGAPKATAMRSVWVPSANTAPDGTWKVHRGITFWEPFGWISFTWFEPTEHLGGCSQCARSKSLSKFIAGRKVAVGSKSEQPCHKDFTSCSTVPRNPLLSKTVAHSR